VGEGGKMTQTLYAHMNKKKVDRKSPFKKNEISLLVHFKKNPCEI
jgi:hypothetical protein